jgi:hypothetical protein
MNPPYEQLVEIVESLREENRRLKERVERLEKELRKYVNENTPSGSIPPYLKKLEEDVNRVSKDEKKDPPKENVRNARLGHIDRNEHHSLDDPICPTCGGHARRRGKSTRKRVIIELQLPKAEVVEHESDVYQCTECGKEFAAPVPNALPNTEFDIRTTVLMSLLSTGMNVTDSNIVSFLRLFGVDVSEGSVTNALKRLKRYLGPYYSGLEQKVKAAAVRYKDETSHRHNGRTFWTWAIATTDWVYYAIRDSRGHKVAKSLESTHGVDVCDGYAGYDRLQCRRQRDWAHLLRIGKKPKYDDFGREENYDDYRRCVRGLALILHDAKVAKERHGPSQRLRERFEVRFFRLVASMPRQGKNFKRLNDYIMRFNNEWFTFLEYKDVEPTSNRAERAMRPVVIKRRVSQQTRGDDSMDSYAMQMSLYMSSKLQGQDYVENLSNILASQITSKP